VGELEGAQRKAVEIWRVRVREAPVPGILHSLYIKRAQALHTIILVAFSEKRADKKRCRTKGGRVKSWLRTEREARSSGSVHSAPIGRLAFPGACLKFSEEKKGKRRNGDVSRENSGTRRAPGLEVQATCSFTRPPFVLHRFFYRSK